ncbi:ATP-dependent RecD-like DNA helicase [Robiginitalea sp. SC105]|uniref:ATP-dependent DNA helicase n=1 Tax=Robiginitalea sp. SC105 TaxID=2762332 RepID=UPI00163B2539|nr:ATP-binding domain-containing protein [Robiginitalea sp. SC105]MBC2840224.1 AAA family ATPase [Robiginitalea sp. SC105]
MESLTAPAFYRLLEEKFPHDPTRNQGVALKLLSDFIIGRDTDKIFLLKGYAGTGKTTLLGTLIANLWHTKKKAVLMAPTGRAAKVMSSYTNTRAFTIHRQIYIPKKERSGGVRFTLSPNRHRNTLFIVDEASMIPDAPVSTAKGSERSLLDDLMTYVYSGFKCQLVLIGDTAQLPPVKLSLSPALQADTLELSYSRDVIELELDEVVRQTQDSGILMNATGLREALAAEPVGLFKFDLEGYADIVRLIDGYEIQDAINRAFDEGGKEETAVIVRSNKRANLYNENIRSRLLFLENELAVGDYMMVVKNNYFWLKSNSEAGFIANGDIIEVLEIFSIKDLYGFRFAEVKVRMVDYPGQKPFETVLLLDTIKAESPALSYEDGNRLYQEVMQDYAGETSSYKKFLSVKNNPHFNALQVKFSYAITCHKSQGGQWETVFVEQPYLREAPDREYLRWLYTAVTRARSKLYLIGFQNDFFVNGE